MDYSLCNISLNYSHYRKRKNHISNEVMDENFKNNIQSSVLHAKIQISIQRANNISKEYSTINRKAAKISS
ncbi:Pyroglutamylated RF-amide peptide receptor [Trichinella spiralis]|uniref:Pyroglutamylated RF-amide peptide receptor n=1 Tax=Trichinella spiralis TaxID=6334 RepID=A0ABR3K4H9_TRISP